MNIARMNVRISIQKSTVTADRYGNRRNTWEPYLDCYATVSGEAPKEETDAGLVVDDSKIDFTIRYCRAAEEITSTGYRVLFHDEIYDILGVDHMNYKHKSMKLLCQKVRR